MVLLAAMANPDEIEVQVISSPREYPSSRCSGSTSSKSHFQNLLQELEKEHERQVSLIRSEIAQHVGVLEKPAEWNGCTDDCAHRQDSTTSNTSNNTVKEELTRYGSNSSRCPPDAKQAPPMMLGDEDPEANDDEAPSFRPAVTHSHTSTELYELNHKWRRRISEHSLEETPFGTSFVYSRTSKVLGRKESMRTGQDNEFIKLHIAPNSQFRMCWDFASGVLVAWDVFSVPLWAFKLSKNFFSEGMGILALVFWSVDLVLNFFTAFYKKGHLVTRRREIALHYVRTWFLIDIVVVLSDWLLLFLEGFGSSYLQFLKGVRTIRVLRLLRVIKLQAILNKLYDLIDNEYTFIFVDLVKMLMFIFVLNHVIACGWFWVGKKGHENGYAAWVYWQNMNYLREAVAFQYTTSLHWSLTQFTPASMDVVARNVLERLYSIIVLLFAMVGFSSIVGTVTSSMTCLRTMKNDKQKAFWTLRRYLKQKGISADLTHRMTKYLEHQVVTEEKMIQVVSVKLLSKISEQLAEELALEMKGPIIEQHPFFNILNNDMRVVSMRLCHTGLKSKQLAAGDLLFPVGEEALSAFVVKSGALAYMTSWGGHLRPDLYAGEWIAEAILWTRWRFHGTCHSAAPTELLVLEAEQFVRVMGAHPVSWSFAVNYGRKFVDYLNTRTKEDRIDLVREADFLRQSAFEAASEAL